MNQGFFFLGGCFQWHINFSVTCNSTSFLSENTLARRPFLLLWSLIDRALPRRGKWFSKSDRRKNISCALTRLLLLQVLQEKQINSTALVLNKSIIKIPKHCWYCSSKQTKELHSFIDALSVKGLCFTLFEGPESPYYFCLQKHCGAHERDRGKKPFFLVGGRMAGSWLPLFFFLFHLKKLLGWLISDLDYHILPVVPCSVYWNFLPALFCWHSGYW